MPIRHNHGGTATERSPWLWALLALLVVAVTVAAGVIRYPTMPAILSLSATRAAWHCSWG